MSRVRQQCQFSKYNVKSRLTYLRRPLTEDEKANTRAPIHNKTMLHVAAHLCRETIQKISLWVTYNTTMLNKQREKRMCT